MREVFAFCGEGVDDMFCRGEGRMMGEGKMEMLVERFAFIVKPMIHGEGTKGRLMGVLMSRVGVVIKSCLHEEHGKYLVFGCGCVK
jgi:hypothetical protein